MPSIDLFDQEKDNTAKVLRCDTGRERIYISYVAAMGELFPKRIFIVGYADSGYLLPKHRSVEYHRDRLRQALEPEMLPLSDNLLRAVCNTDARHHLLRHKSQ